MARNILITRKHWSDDGTYSGGSWLSAAPLTNLKDPRPQVMAEATSTATAHTQFTVDFGYSRLVGMLYFARLLASVIGDMRVRLSEVSNFATTTYDSGWVPVHPQVRENFEYDDWGVYQVSGRMVSDEYLRLGAQRVLVPAAPVWARYCKVEFDDTSATAAVQLGRFIAAEVFEPEINIGYDWSLTATDRYSDVQRVPYGSVYTTSRTPRRLLNIGFDVQPESDVFGRQLDHALYLGRTRSFVTTIFAEDAAYLERSTVYGHSTQDITFRNPFFGRYSSAWTIEEHI